jgi:hypothetical protein
VTLTPKQKAADEKYQAALADLDKLTYDQMEDLVRELRAAGMFSEGHNLGGRWRQNRYQKRQQTPTSSSGTSESSSTPNSEPNGGPSSAIS